MFDSRLPVLVLAATTGLALMQPQRALAQWWRSAPTDFEECADVAEKAASKEEKTAALADCNAKFAGRRKAGGGYTYYDFMQDRSFDIAGPNPTPEEQRFIDQQYTQYLEKQRRNNVTAAFINHQQPQELQTASLRDLPERSAIEPEPLPTVTPGRVPIPVQRPTKSQMAANAAALADARARAKTATCTKDPAAKESFSCNWPVLSEKLGELKKLFSGPATPQTGKTAKKG